MADESTLKRNMLPTLFRIEFAKLTALLCRQFGIKNLSIAEDIASDTFLKASEHWALQGMPDNPTAWLYRVAINKTKDYLKRSARFEMNGNQFTETEELETDLILTQSWIADSQLAMIFAVCNPLNPPEAQICLALQILCGFSVKEIASAFLTRPDTIKKRLYRARTKLREEGFQLTELTDKQIKPRLDAVLRTLYLLFNEGYYSQNTNQFIRKDLCAEALRLTLLLTENSWTNTAQANALLALMCYQSSRLAARIDASGEVVLFDNQDKTLWDEELIARGHHYLVTACEGSEISKYHLEAGIAYWHTTSSANKWGHILPLYDQLVTVEYSPITALNRVFALAKVYGHQQAIAETEALNLLHSSYYHQVLGYLYTGVELSRALTHYQAALELTESTVEKRNIVNEIERLRKVN